ncbi:MAG: hypothetical protein M0Q43_11345 [Methanothrix sp.]|jgi:hypothetical protein|nr:hypothetical protein [Methanothrix sp.]
MATLQELRKKYNYNPSSGQGTSQPLTLSQLREKHGYTPPPEPEYPNGIQQFKDTAMDTGASLAKRGGDIKETFQQVAEGEINPIRGAVRTVGSSVGAAGDVLGGVVVGAAKAITPAPVEKAVSSAGSAILNTSVGKAGLSAIQSGLEAYENWKAKNEGAAEDLEAIINIASIFPMEKGIVGAGKMASKAAVGTAEKLATQVAKTGEAMTDLKSRFRLNPRKMEEILAVPKEKVSTLPINEQKVWYDNQREALKGQVAKTGEQAAQEFATKKTVLSESTKKAVSEYEAQAVKLQKDLEVTARDKVIELRPKMIEGMRKQSDTYRSLVDDAMADKKGMTIDKDDIKGFINRFADDEVMANAVKQRLGLIEQVDPLKAGEMVGLEMRKKTTTIGKMYEQAKGLRQEISKSPTRAYTPKDKITDDTIDVLLSYMKESGVDLTEANQFWARYAPIRNKMIREAKPFIQSGIETKTFAKTLERVAKGADVNNDIFISEVEEILGQSVTADIRKAVSNISNVEKKKIAAQMQEEMEKLDIELQEEAIKKSLKEGEEKGMEKIKTTEFETNRIARKRQIFKNILKLVIPGAVGASVIGAF